MGKRSTAYYPTDPFAVELLRGWLSKANPSALREPWQDRCAGYGALLSGLVPFELRHAVEVQPGLRRELERRVPKSQLRIGNGLARPATEPHHIGENPPFDHDVMAAFVRTALEHRRRFKDRPLVCMFALSTFWHSEGLRDLRRIFGRPDWTLGLGFRATCDGSGVGDMRSHDWLVWDGSHSDAWSRCIVLPKPAVQASAIAEHRRLSSLDTLGAA